MKEKQTRFNSFSQILKFIMGVISWTIFVILILIAIFLLYYFISTKLYAEKGEKFKPQIGLYTILTGSMEPNINPYDVIVDWAILKPTDIKIGDVITFVSTSSLTKGMTITHRVINIKEDQNGYSYQTKGDANLSPDTAYVPFANIKGKVLFRIPQLGRLQSFLATKGGWLIIVVIPALIVIITDMLKVFRLVSSKGKVDDLKRKEEIKRKLLINKKEKAEQYLQKRYREERNKLDKDPILHKNYVIISKNNFVKREVQEDDLPKKIDLPKLK